MLMMPDLFFLSSPEFKSHEDRDFIYVFTTTFPLPGPLLVLEKHLLNE